MASLFLTGLGAKLGLIFAYGSPFPYADQWPAIAINLFIPYLSNQYTPALLFKAPNEHRIVFTRLSELLLLVANGQWDCQLEMLVNAVIHCATMAGLGWLLASMLGKKYWLLLWLMLVACLALPIAWENTLWGFQSQFYFLIAFSLIAVWGLGLGKPMSGFRWLAGVGCSRGGAVCDGVRAFFAVAAVVIGAKTARPGHAASEIQRRLRCRRWFGNLRRDGGGGNLLLKTKVPEHSQYSSVHSAGEFLTALTTKNLAWPWPLHPWYALFNMLPLALLSWKYLRAKDETQPIEKLILGIGLWAGLQSAAAAFARGARGATPAWRYMDLLAFVMIANGLSIIILLRAMPVTVSAFPVYGRRGLLLGCGHLGCASGLWFLSEKAWQTYLPDIAQEQEMQLRLSREFITSNDPRVFDGKPSLQLLVLNLDAEVWLLQHPLLRAIMPACAREGASDPFPLNERGRFVLCAKVRTYLPITIGRVKFVGAFITRSLVLLVMGILKVSRSNRALLPYLEIPVAGNLGTPHPDVSETC